MHVKWEWDRRVTEFLNALGGAYRCADNGRAGCVYAAPLTISKEWLSDQFIYRLPTDAYPLGPHARGEIAAIAEMKLAMPWELDS